MWKNRVFWLVLLAAMLVFHAYYDGWISWYMLLLSICLPLFSLLCSLPAVVGLKTAVTGQANVDMGQPCELIFTLKPRWRFSGTRCRLWLQVEDVVSGKSKKQKLNLEKNVWSGLAVPTEHCGAYRFVPVKARAYDYLGIFAFPVKTAKAFTVTVWPSVEAPDPEPDFSAFRAKAYRPKPGGGYSEIHELRQYRPGDPLRSVHWKLSAKTDDLVVRESQEVAERSALVTLDGAADRTRLDRTLGILRWVSGKLTELETAHTVCCVSGTDMHIVNIIQSEDLDNFIHALLQGPVDLPRTGASAAGAPFAQTAWRYHIDPDRQEVAQ